MKNALVIASVLALSAIGCMRPAQSEVGTPTQRYSGRALIVLPRSCVIERSVPQRHFENRSPSLEVPAKTERLQAMLDQLPGAPGAPQAIGPRPESECSTPPGDIWSDISDLTQVRATDETIRAMHESGASHVVVLEVHTVLACAQRAVWSPNDLCLEDEVTLTAWMFDERGAAVWALTRAVAPTDEPGYVLDRFLDRIPTEEPLRRSRGEYEVAGGAGRAHVTAQTASRSPSL